MSDAAIVRIIGYIILYTGLVAAGIIYRQNAPYMNDASVVRWEVVDGKPFPIYAQDSKTAHASALMMGGAAMEQTTELREWLGSLWHGRRLAYTLGVLSILTWLAALKFAQLLAFPVPPAEPKS